MIDVIFTPAKNLKYIKRSIWSIVARRPKELLNIYVEQQDGIEGVVSEFYSMLKATIVPNTNDLFHSFINQNRNFFVLDSSAIVWANAMELLRGTGSKISKACIYNLPGYIEEKLDPYGANIHPGMVEHSKSFCISDDLIQNNKTYSLSYVDSEMSGETTVKEATCLLQGEI